MAGQAGQQVTGEGGVRDLPGDLLMTVGQGREQTQLGGAVAVEPVNVVPAHPADPLQLGRERPERMTAVQ